MQAQGITGWGNANCWFLGRAANVEWASVSLHIYKQVCEQTHSSVLAMLIYNT